MNFLKLIVCIKCVIFFFLVKVTYYFFFILASGPVRAYRPRSPPPPPPPPPPPQPPRPSPPSPSPSPGRQVWIPLSNGLFALDNGNTVVRRNYTGRIRVHSDSQGNRVVTEEPLTEESLRRFQDLEESFTGVRSTPRKNTKTPPPRPPPPRIPPQRINLMAG